MAAADLIGAIAVVVVERGVDDDDDDSDDDEESWTARKSRGRENSSVEMSQSSSFKRETLSEHPSTETPATPLPLHSLLISFLSKSTTRTPPYRDNKPVFRGCKH